ncbi:MAG TPA: transcription antitermination factor NusB, partial [Streptosporangiaceae bacterium]
LAPGGGRRGGAGGRPTRGDGRTRAARSGGRRSADPVRWAALEVLRAVGDRDAYANLLLPSVLRDGGLSGRDAALATELTYGTLRGRGTYDAVLTACSDRPLDRIDPPVLEVLRLGTHQLLATRVRAYAAVATSVDLARDAAGAGAAKFANAVLRKVAAHDLETWIDNVAPPRASDPLGHLAVRYSHPRWVVAAFSESLGEDEGSGFPETQAALAADADRPGVTLCVVPGLADPAELVTEGAESARWSPFGVYLKSGDPAGLTAIAEGRAGVQDEASQLAALALTRVDAGSSDSRWLDVCAGPGGKARLLAGLAAARGARLIAADVRPHRARLVRDATAVAGAVGVVAADDRGAGLVGDATAVAGAVGVVVADGCVPAWRPGSFDRVIADVPCSGLGALRRRPDARWRKSPPDVTALGGLQRRLLAHALDAARPGGVVAYVTCSPHVAETRAVVADVVGGRNDVTVIDAPGVLPEVPGLRCPEPESRFAQFWPHRHGADAIFLALLRRAPLAEDPADPSGQVGSGPGRESGAGSA